MGSLFEFTDEHGRGATISLPIQCGENLCTPLKNQCLSHLQGGISVTLDLSQTEALDKVLLGCFLELNEIAAQYECRFSLLNPHGAVLELLHRLHFEQLMTLNHSPVTYEI
ncbi:STAS domain-containing protein [Neptuniibacter halophilus]|uniref:STAS domain-containing protein n=1 Tax=Neptuniibacter halophilus TaxID=651666 RepID=UPI0025727C12|nr:STAS domain-containing protein [Neptuniibacter halophilus]